MRVVRALSLILAGAVHWGVALAQDFPAREMTLLVPFGPGGPPDAIAPAVAEGSFGPRKQRVGYPRHR